MQKGTLIQLRYKPRLNEVKPPGGCLGFFKGILSSKLDKNPGANSASEFDNYFSLILTFFHVSKMISPEKADIFYCGWNIDI